MLQLIGMLLAVVAVLFLSWYLTRKLGTVAGYRGNSSPNLKVLDRIPLGQNESLIIVRAGRKFLLLGITPAGITCLKQLEQDEINQDGDGENHLSHRSSVDFRSLLEQIKRGSKDGK